MYWCWMEYGVEASLKYGVTKVKNLLKTDC